MESAITRFQLRGFGFVQNFLVTRAHIFVVKLVHIVSKKHKQAFDEYIHLAASEESPEIVILFYHSERAFRLN